MWEQYKAEDWKGMEALVNEKDINGGWSPNGGFISKKKTILKKGTKIDRYDGPDPLEDRGKFTSPLGDSFEGRALPENYKEDKKDMFYKYEVVEDIAVTKGEAIPWFGQEGEGTQYMTKKSFAKLLKQGKIKLTS